MRLLQLATGPGQMLDLHPNVSVVTGLDDDQRAVLVDAVTRLARAEAVAGSGLLEAYGIMFDLDPELLNVIEFAIGDLDPVVHHSQLPSQATSSETRALRVNEHRMSELSASIADLVERRATLHQAHEAAVAAVDKLRARRHEAELGARTRQERHDELIRRRDELSARQRGIDAELADVGPSLASAHSARAEIEERTASVRAAVDDATKLRVSVEEELARLDPISHDDAQTEADAARATLQALEAKIEVERAEEAERKRARAEAEAAAAAVHEPPLEPASVRLERLDQRLQDLEQLLVILTPVHRAAVEQAREQVVGGDATPLVHSPEAILIADDLDQVTEQLAEFEQGAAVSSVDVSPADGRARLDEARQALLEAEGALRSTDLDPDLVAKLEAVHAELVDAIERSYGRFSPGAKRAAAQVDGLRAAEEELLDELGFASYSTYLMGYSIGSADPQATAALHVAREELAEAEKVWRVLERATERALMHAQLMDERRRILDAARRMLGHAVAHGLPQAELRSLRVPAVSAQESARVLRDLLDEVGLDLGDEDLDRDELLLIADAWLDQVDQVDDRRRTAADELSNLRLERIVLSAEADAELAVAESGAAEVLVADGGSADEPDPEARRRDQLANARSALAIAEQRLADATSTAERRSVLLDDLSTAQELEQGAVEVAAEAQQEVAASVAAVAPLANRAAMLEEEQGHCAEELLHVEAAIGGLEEPAPDLDAIDADLVVAEGMLRDAATSLADVDSSLAGVEAQRDELSLEMESLRDLVAAEVASDATPIKELEWYLLARLASQRSVSVAGSVPLLLHDTLRGFDAEDVDYLLTRLERMAEAVQVIVISDDPVVVSWASSVGLSRAAVVMLEPA
ncbi:MAG: hypothetical protein WD691_10850 [Acidimicrobiales bacterium]